MQTKNDITNRYSMLEEPTKYTDTVKNYTDLINQATGMDAIADGFKGYGKLKAKNHGERLNNLTLEGVGNGLQAAANDKRQEKLAPIIEQAGQINALAAMNETQIQEFQQKKLQTQQFVTDQSFSFLELAKSIKAGDTTATNNITRGILQSYKNFSGDSKIGDFNHYYDGEIYYTNAETGGKEALSIPLLLNQSGIAPELFGADYNTVMSSVSTGFEGNYENEQELQRQKIAMGQANIDDKRSHTNLQDVQAEEIGHKIENPQLSPSQIKTKDLNEVKFAKLHEKAEEKRILSIAYDEYIDNILDAKKKGLTGKSTAAEWNRYWAGITGQSENMDVEEMLRITHANRVKELGGSNANIRQFDVAMASAPSITKDPDATIKFLDKIIDENTEFEKEVNHIGSIWENNNYQGQERSILNEYRKENPANKNRKDRVRDEDKNPEQPSDAFVVMTNQETGEEWDVPKGQVELFSNNGYK